MIGVVILLATAAVILAFLARQPRPPYVWDLIINDFWHDLSWRARQASVIAEAIYEGFQRGSA